MEGDAGGVIAAVLSGGIRWRICSAQQNTDRGWNFIRMNGAPRNNFLNFEGIVGDGTHDDHFVLNSLGVSHAGFSMTQAISDIHTDAIASGGFGAV